MPYILVSADFPDINSEARKQIYECLAKKSWKKIKGEERDLSTTWFKQALDNTDQKLKELAIHEFTECSKKFINCRLAIQTGPFEPKLYNI